MDDEIKAHDGKLVLYRRNGIYQARIHLGRNDYLHRTLKTANTEEAKRLGEELWHDTRYKLKNGLPVQKKSLNKVLDEYLGVREADNEMGKRASSPSVKYTSDEMLRQLKRVQWFWREYAGQRAVDSIDRSVLSDYVPWRKSYYHNKKDVSKRAKLNPTDKTLQWEMMFIKMVLRWAKEERGYLGDKEVPKFSVKQKTKRVRPDFTLSEYKTLRSSLHLWMSTARGAVQRQSRQLLHDYVMTLALSGIRVGEANNLKIRDIQVIRDSLDRLNVQFHVRGKTGERTVVPHIDLKEVIDQLLARRTGASDDDWLFVTRAGEQLDSLRDQFDRFLEEYKLTYSATGAKHSLYSLRHFYAVRAIARGIDIYVIARNMGTSVKMIEDYYGRHATTTSRAAKLGGEAGEPQTVARLATFARPKRGMQPVPQKGRTRSAGGPSGPHVGG